MGLTASQIRQDLNCLWTSVSRDMDIQLKSLYNEIGHILGLDHSYKAILIGAGNLGKAVAVHMSFEKRGFQAYRYF